MSELKEYIEKALEKEYKKIGVISETPVNTITVYGHTESGNRLVLIRSGYRNDEVFRKLKSINTGGLMPIIYEVCSEEDFLYVLEEYIDGRSLTDYLSGECDYTERELYKFLVDICAALEIIHGLGIVHRDIKPENIIISKGKACLIDFSVSRIINYSQKDTVNLGTAGYAAPEQYGISESQPSSDIYAFGVLANILLTGEHPTTKIPSGKIGRIIRKCTDIQISKRYQSAGELKKQLIKL
ncbi:MAG: serine/threonine protein kinase [Eubacterium sp.]|nr:serine/threonine protein kinase [Eubacterium sp.]